MSYITTVSGKHFDPVDPEEKLIDLDDIAHSLSLLCRGNGHIRFFYSVAQHSLACAREAYERGYEKEVVLACLLHDASEAYLSDVTRPVKKDLPYYLEVEDRLQNLLFRHFIGRDLTEEETKKVFEIDDQMLSLEFHQLFANELNEDYLLLKRDHICSFEDPIRIKADFLAFFQRISEMDGERAQKKKKIKNILITNDDGIEAEGLLVLAKAAAAYGNVWVVAPDKQCSAMSHRVTVHKKMSLEKRTYPVPVAAAYALGGMPADCIKVAIYHLMEEKPDFVLTGVNHGLNIGYDTNYSATVGSAMEATMNGIPAIAFSNGSLDNWDLVEAYLPGLIGQVMEREIAGDQIWNVNFPDCSLEECKGLRWDTRTAKTQIFSDEITEIIEEDGSITVNEDGPMILGSFKPVGTDVEAICDKYISIGKIRRLQ